MDLQKEFTDYENHMSGLERDSYGNFMSYLRMEPAMFYESVQKLNP